MDRWGKDWEIGERKNGLREWAEAHPLAVMVALVGVVVLLTLFIV